MILIRNAEVYAPEYMGIADVLTGGGKILEIDKDINLPDKLLDEVIDAKGFILIPGLIDAHVHITGAGGEGGPATRTPELHLSHMLEAGITTVVGCLGTDGITRSVESVLMKVKALRQEGVSAWMYTGAYQVPVPSILGDVGKDVAMIEEVIGVGEVALSDHRSSHPTTDELIRIASLARVGGMLGNKAGIVNIHMGDARDPFRPIYEAVERSELKLKQFYPTHCNRNDYIFNDAKDYGKEGYIDITASSYPYFPQYEIKPSRAVKEFLEVGVPLEHITMTSDACGSLPHFDEKGKLVQLEMGYPKSMFTELIDMITKERISVDKALRVVTSNPADILKITRKGRIAKGMDADLLVLDGNYNMASLFANGSIMVREGKIIRKGSYEH